MSELLEKASFLHYRTESSLPCAEKNTMDGTGKVALLLDTRLGSTGKRCAHRLLGLLRRLQTMCKVVLPHVNEALVKREPVWFGRD
jgi:hypothetical protein